MGRLTQVPFTPPPLRPRRLRVARRLRRAHRVAAGERGRSAGGFRKETGGAPAGIAVDGTTDHRDSPAPDVADRFEETDGDGQTGSLRELPGVTVARRVFVSGTVGQAPLRAAGENNFYRTFGAPVGHYRTEGTQTTPRTPRPPILTPKRLPQGQTARPFEEEDRIDHQHQDDQSDQASQRFSGFPIETILLRRAFGHRHALRWTGTYPRRRDPSSRIIFSSATTTPRPPARPA